MSEQTIDGAVILGDPSTPLAAALKTVAVKNGDDIWMIGKDLDSGFGLRLGRADDPKLARMHKGLAPLNISVIFTFPRPASPATLALISETVGDEKTGVIVRRRIGDLFVQEKFLLGIAAAHPGCVWYAPTAKSLQPVQAVVDDKLVGFIMPLATTQFVMDEAVRRGFLESGKVADVKRAKQLRALSTEAVDVVLADLFIAFATGLESGVKEKDVEYARITRQELAALIGDIAKGFGAHTPPAALVPKMVQSLGLCAKAMRILCEEPV